MYPLGLELCYCRVEEGAHLLKCGRRGKPKFCPFRLSSDETALIWYSAQEERRLNLNSVVKVVPGQQTVNFLRQPQPGKEAQSLSLIYQSDGRSLDLICKDKEQAETWFLALKVMVSESHNPPSKAAIKHTKGTQSVAISPVGNGWRKHNGEFLELLKSTDTLEVRNIFCGKQYASLVTKQGEIFTWGEEHGGRLGHKTNLDVPYPKLVDSLVSAHVVSVACGVSHACALTSSGEVYEWGDSCHGAAHPGEGNRRSQWIPRRLAGPLSGISISKVACGDWHTAVVSSSGQLFTYGNGVFGVLGHGDLASASRPKEVDALRGMRVKSVACGPWHTAAVVEVGAGRCRGGDSSSGKLFTWGDNDEGKLGHPSKDKKLVPTCVAALADHDFVQVSCGVMLTVVLTITGTVFAMGLHPRSAWEPRAGALKGEYVKEISAGSFHVAALTAKGQVYTWGKGRNGRLGLGDAEDRNSPACVEALKDRQVQCVACGSSFTAAICLHRSILSCDQSVCNGCHLVFGFTRKKHNCYNCGLLFCHSCTGRKALNASLAPDKNKQSRVCDSCFKQLKVSESSSLIERETSSPRLALLVQKRLSVRNLTRECQDKVEKLEQCKQRVKETLSMARDEAARCIAAKDAIKALTEQMNAIAEKFPAAGEVKSLGSILYDRFVQTPEHACIQTKLSEAAKLVADANGAEEALKDIQRSDSRDCLSPSADPSIETKKRTDRRRQTGSPNEPHLAESNASNPSKTEWIEQDEPGVYITFMILPSGRKGLKRVRFSRRQFSEKEAEKWWKENQIRVYVKYDIEQMASTASGKT
ncbi:unnamed protein product [Spirodela intermedia]|uniref:Uncharacterized protein n=1 Tax=Spirodela intermedia TaxID=51605 RepID=A0A7I8IFE9_SPIIN|nr:unnamed protein product [Spirodela intermedia]CAA6655823.1 unnamed protein product [Spirodela intermedia]